MMKKIIYLFLLFLLLLDLLCQFINVTASDDDLLLDKVNII